MTDWMPIETAPRDGTEIIMSNGERVGGGQWYERGGWNDDACEYFGAWRWANDSCDCCWDDADPQPTHWMPLPGQPDGWVAAPPVEHKPDDDMEWNDE